MPRPNTHLIEPFYQIISFFIAMVRISFRPGVLAERAPPVWGG